jgi:carbamoyltransferase
LHEVIKLHEDGSFSLNLEYFDFMRRDGMYSKKLPKLLDVIPRAPESKILNVHCDLAASIQKVLEIAILNLVSHAKKLVDSQNLCLAGGVALNCVANSVIFKEGLFENIWIQPAAGDAGGALGAALAFGNMSGDIPLGAGRGLDENSETDFMFGAYLGREFKDYEIKNALISNNLKFHSGNSAEDLINIIAIDLSKGMSVGWFQGRSEFGPRALGARSILADPRSPETQKRLNLQTKFRESFRPFAPSILEEDYKAWFDWSSPSPYMLFVADVRPEHRIPIDTTAVASQTCETSVERINQVRSTVPAVTHVDYSARLQTVSIKTNPLYHRLITAFKEITGVPILVNTSFNIRGEPIVDSPEDAIRCFLGTDIDVLFIGDYIVYKKENMDRLRDYRKLYDLD